MALSREESPAADVSLFSPLAADYHILAKLERDDLGTVFLAQQRRVGARRVALRVLPPAAEWDPERLAEFERQVAAVARLRHPSVPVVYECGELPDGTAYLATELCDGETLAARLERTGPLPESDLLAIAEKCAQALDTGHRAGIEHCQLSVDRIILVAGLDATPEVKLKDFGLAHGEAIHAPDREHGREASGAGRLDRSDIVSLALVTKAMLTGRWPGVQEAALADAAPPPPIPAPLRTVLGQALDAAGGYSTAGEFVQALREVMTKPAPTAPERQEPSVAPATASRAGSQVPGPVQGKAIFERPLDDAELRTPPPPWRARRSVESAPPPAVFTPAPPEVPVVSAPSDSPPAVILDQAEAEKERIHSSPATGTRVEEAPAQGSPPSSMEEASELNVTAGTPGLAGEPDGSGEEAGPTRSEATSPAPGAAEERAELRTRYAALQAEHDASGQTLAELRVLMARLQNEHQRMRETLDTVQQLI